MTLASNETHNPLAARRALIKETYGDMIGRPVQDVPTPALLVDLPAAERNIARMAATLKDMPAQIRPHIKVHKSAELAARQVAAGAIGLSMATVWEAVAARVGWARQPLRGQYDLAPREDPGVGRARPFPPCDRRCGRGAERFSAGCRGK